MVRAAALMLLAAAAAAHAAPPMRPRLWEITARMQGEGMASAPAQSIRTCIAQEDIDLSKGAVPGADRGMENCQVTDFRQDGDKASWKFSCTGRGAMSGTGSISYAAESFTQQTSMKTAGSEKVALTVSTLGRRIGDCAK